MTNIQPTHKLSHSVLFKVELRDIGRTHYTRILNNFLSEDYIIANGYLDTVSDLKTMIFDTGSVIELYASFNANANPLIWYDQFLKDIRIYYKDSHSACFVLDNNDMLLKVYKSNRLTYMNTLVYQDDYINEYLCWGVQDLPNRTGSTEIKSIDEMESKIYFVTHNKQALHELNLYLNKPSAWLKQHLFYTPPKIAGIRLLADMWAVGRYGVLNTRYNAVYHRDKGYVELTGYGDLTLLAERIMTHMKNIGLPVTKYRTKQSVVRYMNTLNQAAKVIEPIGD